MVKAFDAMKARTAQLEEEKKHLQTQLNEKAQIVAQLTMQSEVRNNILCFIMIVNVIIAL